MEHLTGDEIPSSRADPEIRREEDFDFILKTKVPGFAAELTVKRRGPDRSPTAKATTTLLLVAGACFASVTIAAICELAHSSALLLIIAAFIAFASVMIAGTIISFRRDGSRSGLGVMSRHLRPARHDEGNGTAQALSREAHQNGHETKEGQNGQVSQPGADRSRRRRK
jgi:hypothetical protein